MTNSEFWNDKVQRFKKTDKTQELIGLCRKNIPLPASFREIAIAIRKQIRVCRKNKQDYEELLIELYNNAVQENFFMSVNWGQVINQEHMCSIAQPFIPRIKCPYEEIGYEFLKQLTVTDVKWIVGKWGEPKRHSNAKDVNGDLWVEANEAYRVGGEKEEAEQEEELERILAEEEEEEEEEEERILAEEEYTITSKPEKKSESTSVIEVVIILVIMIYVLTKC
jgi:hypothetical protein